MKLQQLKTGPYLIYYKIKHFFVSDAFRVNVYTRTKGRMGPLTPSPSAIVAHSGTARLFMHKKRGQFVWNCRQTGPPMCIP